MQSIHSYQLWRALLFISWYFSDGKTDNENAESMEHNRKGDQIHWSELVLSLPPSIDSVPSLFLARPFLSPNQNNYRQVLTQEIINEIRRFFLWKSQLWRSRSSHSKLVEVTPVPSSAFRPACRSQRTSKPTPFPWFSSVHEQFSPIKRIRQRKEIDTAGTFWPFKGNRSIMIGLLTNVWRLT